MPTDEPQYKMESGTPEQLPKGAATELNSADIPQDDGQDDYSDLPQGPVNKVPRGSVKASGQLDEMSKMAFGPTSRPDEPITQSAGRGRVSQQPVPRELYPQLVGLAEAAKDPTAPKQVVMLARLLAASIGEDN